MNESKKYWFPAKTHGWGWGIPCSWQGWVVFLGYIGTVIGASYWKNPAQHPKIGYLIIMIATALLLTICLLKGEPPKWRWGNKTK